MIKRFIACGNCGNRLSRLLSKEINFKEVNPYTEQPLVEPSCYTSNKNDLYISTEAKWNMQYHYDKSRLVGCCGPSVDGLPNLVCNFCNQEVAREVTDCCTSHYIVFNLSAIQILEDINRLYEKIDNLSISEEQKKQLETLLFYNQIESFNQEIEIFNPFDKTQ
ncbi:MAG: hypothetical protein MUC49_14580 [Raineya sp.]|jgi:hypothetical protein|nr:hypothetical protein [Raineya sp.]